jgi:hypothetical protein
LTTNVLDVPVFVILPALLLVKVASFVDPATVVADKRTKVFAEAIVVISPEVLS